MSLPKLLTVAQVREFVPLSKAQIYTLIAQGKLVGYQDGPEGKYLVRADSVERYLESIQLRADGLRRVRPGQGRAS